MKEIINEKIGKLTAPPHKEIPKIIFISEEIRDSVIKQNSFISSLISDEIESDSVLFIVSPTPSPYVDEVGRLHLSQIDFNNLLPFLMEFFSSKQRGIPINEAFQIFLERLSGKV